MRNNSTLLYNNCIGIDNRSFGAAEKEIKMNKRLYNKCLNLWEHIEKQIKEIRDSSAYTNAEKIEAFDFLEKRLQLCTNIAKSERETLTIRTEIIGDQNEQ